MQNLHKHALVPITADSIHAPEAKLSGCHVDIGLMCEALLYYESVYVNIPTPETFLLFLKWFEKRGLLSELISLLEEKSIRFYDFPFTTNLIRDDRGIWVLMNIRDTSQVPPRSFIPRYLLSEKVKALFVNSNKYDKFINAASDGLKELTTDDFEGNVEVINSDLANPKRHSFTAQTIVDKISPLLKMVPPKIDVKVTKDGSKNTFAYNFNFDDIGRASGVDGFVNMHTPMYAASSAQKYLVSSLKGNFDLFLGSPISEITGDKLYEDSSRAQNVKGLIDKLSLEVEFPIIRHMVNKNQLRLGQVLQIRKKSKRFRDWVQMESEKDRNSIVAYHNELAKDQGFLEKGKRVLEIFGAVGSAAVGTAIIPKVGEVAGTAVGSALGIASQYATGLMQGWKPYVFGDWYKERIKNYLGENV